MSGCISFHSIPLHFDDIVPGNDFRDAWTQGCIIILDQLPWPIIFGHVFVHHATKYRKRQFKFQITVTTIPGAQ